MTRTGRLLLLVIGILLSCVVALPPVDAAPAPASVPAGLVQWSSPSQGATVVSPRRVVVRMARWLAPRSSAQLVSVQPDGSAGGGRGCFVEELDVDCTASSDSPPLADGRYRVVVQARELGGSWTYDGALLDLTVDNGLVPAPEMSLLPVSADHPRIWADGAAPGPSDMRVHVAATDSAGGTVEASTTSRDGRWFVSLDATGLVDGPLDVVATRSDVAGAAPVRAQVVKDTVPYAPVPVQVTPGGPHVFTWAATLPGTARAELVARDHLGQASGSNTVSRVGPGPLTGSISTASLADGPITLSLLVYDLALNGVSMPGTTVLKQDVPSIDTAYDRYRAAGLDLGVPVGQVQERECGTVRGCLHGLRWQVYTAGEIWSAEGVGTFEVHGRILRAWHDAGGIDGSFAMPTSDEGPAGRTGRVSDFQGGDLFWSSTTGVQPLTGAYLAGYEAGSRAGLGMIVGSPVAAAVSTAQPDRTATYQQFTGGRVYVSRAGSQAVWGEVARRLVSLGGERAYGIPRTGEQRRPGRGVEVDFDHGEILWSPATGAHEMHGTLREYYDSGGPALFGYPIGDEEAVPRSSVGARQSRLQQRTLVWSSATYVRSVHGELGRLYEQRAALLGAPASEEVPRYVGEVPRVQQFTGGRGYWSPWTGVHEVHGEILRAYRAPDGHFDNSTLGLPISNEYLYLGQPRSDFEHGNIRWSPAGGAVITYYAP